jgi:hypothetical protein
MDGRVKAPAMTMFAARKFAENGATMVSPWRAVVRDGGCRDFS